MQKLYYISENGEVPTGQVSSTARRGDKWFNQVEVGDVVALTVTETDKEFGEAAIVLKELATYADVLNNADHNSVAFYNYGDGATAAEKLDRALKAAYGPDLKPDDLFTILHILPLAEADSDDEPNPEEETAVRNGVVCDVLRQFGVTAIEYETRVGEISELTRYELAPLRGG